MYFTMQYYIYHSIHYTLYYTILYILLLLLYLLFPIQLLLTTIQIESVEYTQPEISMASNKKAFKQRERTDKHVNTYDTDSCFLAFQQKLNTPIPKLSYTDKINTILTTTTNNNNNSTNKEDLIKNNPLLIYMREKAEIKLLERKFGKRSTSTTGTTTVVTKIAKNRKKDKSEHPKKEKKPRDKGNSVSLYIL